MLAYLSRLARAGVCSFKIEGRMKSSYYLATVVNAYRRAMDGTLSEEAAQAELRKVAHRVFTAAYAEGRASDTVNYSDSQEQGTREYAADVLEGGTKALVRMRNRFRVGDTLEVLSPSQNLNRVFTVTEMTDEDGAPVADAKLVMQKLYIRVPFALERGEILRRVRHFASGGAFSEEK